MKKDSRIGYIHKVDFMRELGEAMGGNEIYVSIEDLKENRPRVEECGLAKVEVTLLKDIKNETK